MFKKIVSNGYILGVVEVDKNGNISEEEFLKIKEIAKTRPSEDGFDFMLKNDDLMWDKIPIPSDDEIPQSVEKEEATESDYLSALSKMGVDLNG